MYNTLEVWIAPLLVTILGGLIVSIIMYLITRPKSSLIKQIYFNKLLNSFNNNFQLCINIYIYNQDKIYNNLNILNDIITNTYILSTQDPPLINVGKDKYIIEEILQSSRDLNSNLLETKQNVDQLNEMDKKIESLNNLRNSFLLFCYKYRSIIEKAL